MQMSPLMMMENAQSMKLLHQLYNSGMKEFQVKGMTSEEMCKVIEEITCSGAMVTDASAFESSLSERLRVIEGYVMEILCDRAGVPEQYEAYVKHTTGYRDLKTKWGTLRCCTRDSGDFWTSAFNGVSNLSLALFCSIVKKIPLVAILEGDDGLVRPGAMCGVILEKLGIKFSSELVGSKSGDVDFLRSLWRHGKRYLCVGRSLGLLWVKRAAHLSRGKQLYLLRMSALSLYHMSPGHPVLTAIINRINKETRHVKRFKNYTRYVDTWKGFIINESKFPDDIQVDESMRDKVAEGAEGFPPIPRSLQLELERVFTEDSEFYVGRLLDAYEDVSLKVAVSNGEIDNSSTDFFRALKESGIKLSQVVAQPAPELSGRLEFPP
jgi:hypothetical protein